MGDWPLRVVSAGNTYYSGELVAFTGRIDPRQVTAGWMILQQDLTRLSRRSSQTVVQPASHVSLLTNPRFAPYLVEAIRQQVEEVRGTNQGGYLISQPISAPTAKPPRPKPT